MTRIDKVTRSQLQAGTEPGVAVVPADRTTMPTPTLSVDDGPRASRTSLFPEPLGAAAAGVAEKIPARDAIAGALRDWGVDHAEPVDYGKVPQIRHLSGRYSWSLAFSPDGTRVISGEGDSTIRVWNAATGQAVGVPLVGHHAPVSSVAASPDGKYIVSGSADKTIRVWDAASGRQIGQPLEGHQGSVTSVMVSADGKRLVSGADDCTIRTWDLATGQQLGPVVETPHKTWGVAASADGTYIVSGSFDHTVRLWDAATGQAVGEPLCGHTGYVFSVAVSPNGDYIVSGSQDKTVRLWSATTHQPMGKPLVGHEDWVRCVAASPDGRFVASGSYDQEVRIWDTVDGRPVGQPVKMPDVIKTVAFDGSGARLVVGHGMGVDVLDFGTPHGEIP